MILLLASLIAAAAPAVDTAPAAVPVVDEVTVTGRREAEIRKIASTLVRTALPAVPAGGQYGRWNVPICTKVQGLADAALADRVVAQMSAIAAQAGARVARPGCRANIVIRFTSDAAVVADRIFAKRADAALLVDTLDRQALRTQPLPVRWWFGWQVEDGSGGRSGDAGSVAAISAGAGAAPLEIPGGGYSVGGNSAASLITAKSRIGLLAATVLVDVDLAAGYGLDAVTAQVAMAVLGQAAVRNQVPPDLSILGLFRGPVVQAPRGLTDWDRALLKALYSVPPNRDQARQRSMIAAAIAKAQLGTGE